MNGNKFGGNLALAMPLAGAATLFGCATGTAPLAAPRWPAAAASNTVYITQTLLTDRN